LRSGPSASAVRSNFSTKRRIAQPESPEQSRVSKAGLAELFGALQHDMLVCWMPYFFSQGQTIIEHITATENELGEKIYVYYYLSPQCRYSFFKLDMQHHRQPFKIQNLKIIGVFRHLELISSRRLRRLDSSWRHAGQRLPA
jgi:hypothetical protein